MKILLCHNFYQQKGGEDVAVLALKVLLEQRGHQVIVFSTDNREIEKYTCLQKIGFFPRTLFSVRTYRRLRQIVAREKPDIAHVHNVFPLLSPAVYIALSRSGVPIVQTIHNYRFMCLNGLFLRAGRICERCKSGNFFSGFRFKCYRNSYTLSGLYALAIGWHRRIGTFQLINRYVAPTTFVAQTMIETGLANPVDISTLGNFLPTPLPDYGTPNLQEPYIVFLGRLSREKGLFTLLTVLREMRHLRLKVLGTGPLAQDLRDYIRQYDLNNVEMLGFMAGEEKYQILRRALCCVMPSDCYESFGFAILESAAVGTPVVASRIGSLATLVSDGDRGLLFRPGDHIDLRAKLEMLLARPELALRMGQQARHWVEANYSSDAHYEAVLNIYQQVAGRHCGCGSSVLSQSLDRTNLIPND